MKKAISIHALLAESDQISKIKKGQAAYFYPRSPCGERQLYDTYAKVLRVFLSTLSLRRATPATRKRDKDNIFLSTLSLRRATHYDNYNLHCVEISIHALLAESDM